MDRRDPSDELRRIRIPVEVDMSNVTATFKNDVLEVKMPKTGIKKKRRITVR
jgi:HSP20 family molecular chaperone IbpA